MIKYNINTIISTYLNKTYLQKYMPERFSDEAIKIKLGKGNLVKTVKKSLPAEVDNEEIRSNEINLDEIKPSPIKNPEESD
jgi:hypothetical protein